jgi:carbon starvation protein
MIFKESDIRSIGYGAMVLEGVVAITALVAACVLAPGDYFALNVPQRTATQRAAYAKLVDTAQSRYNWDLQPKEIRTLEAETRETLVGRASGAVTLAVGMGKVFISLPGMKTLMAYWYHFLIMFEALFILTLLESGTRVARFVFYEILGQYFPRFTSGGKARWSANILISVLTCFAWGYLLYLGNLDTLWRMMGIANQLLATIALVLGTSFILNHSARKVYALCTGLPLAFVIVTVGVASVWSIQGWWVQMKLPATPPDQAFQLWLMCILGSLMVALTAVITLEAAYGWWRILSDRGFKPDVAPAAAQ